MEGARSGDPEPPFLLVASFEFGGEPLCTPRRRCLLRVSQQRSLNQVLLGEQHVMFIGTEPLPPSIITVKQGQRSLARDRRDVSE